LYIIFLTLMATIPLFQEKKRIVEGEGECNTLLFSPLPIFPFLQTVRSLSTHSSLSKDSSLHKNVCLLIFYVGTNVLSVWEGIGMGELRLEEFMSRFNTEEACADYLFQQKWPEGFVCPRCSHRQFYKIDTRRLPLYECALCHYQASLIVGTVMEGSHTALQKWFLAIYLVSQPFPGISAMALKEEIKVTYKTAWLMLHKIRRAMSEADASVQLSGIVQVHDACYGRPYNPWHFTHAEEHPLLVGVNLNEQKEPTYIKMKLLVETPREKRINRQEKENFADRYIKSEESKVEFITERLKPRRLKKGYPLFVNARHWINETFHGLGRRHLQVYLDEFSYRINRMLQNAPLFDSLIQCCASSKAVSYRTIVGRRRRFRQKRLAGLPI